MRVIEPRSCRGALESSTHPDRHVEGVVRPAAVPDCLALVRVRNPVLDRRPAIAADPAATQLGAELLQHLGGDLADRHVAEGGGDVVADTPLVSPAGGRLDLMDTQPRVQRRAEGGFRAGVALLVDLVQQSGEDSAGLGLAGRRLGMR